MSLGPVMLDLRGTELAADEQEMLQHPLVGGVILFSRNYADPSQLQSLTRAVHAVREPRLLVAVDHEGGRVQRFQQEFTDLPPGACFGHCYSEDRHTGLSLCEEAGWLLASELQSVGVDFSFTPVLDLNYGVSTVIGDRAYHRDPDVVAGLALHLVQGMRSAGMAAVGKHFPGHGHVAADSHHETPVDSRRFEDILMADMIPFERLINAGISGIMPAHVNYPEVDPLPAGFSSRWLKEILRKRLAFSGAIFSDDISMAGAEVAGDFTERARAALVAGCDMVLICNNQSAAATVLEQLDYDINPATQVRIMRMHGRGMAVDFSGLKKDDKWQRVAHRLSSLDKTPELRLGDDQINS